MSAIAPYKEGEQLIKEAGGDLADLCFQCGFCTAACPWNTVKEFIVRKMIRQAQFGLVDLQEEEWWQCTTCGACVNYCPRGVRIDDVMVAIRRILVQAATFPSTLKSVLASLRSLGNPMRELREKRADWADGLDVRPFTQGMELLYFPCCVPAYDARLRKVARATAGIMQQAGLDFGILGSEENCCGESVRKVGDEDLFESLAKENIQVFSRADVKKVVVTSPHCYTTFKVNYPDLGGRFEVVHFTQLLARLISKSEVKLEKELGKRVAYHDPCYLGRRSGIYDEPREILNSVPGLDFVELPDSRESSMCCGGGGGRIWMETKKEERFSDLRLKQAIDLGADILATACPYCIMNFEDSALTVDGGDRIEIKDVSEIVQDAISQPSSSL